MPTFSSAQVTDPFLSTNELLAPMLAHLDSQYKLGNLDISRQTLGLEQRKLDQQQSGGQALIDSLSGKTTDGTTPVGGDSTTETADDLTRAAAVRDGLIQRGVQPEGAIAFAANALHESKANPFTGAGDAGASHGIFQWNGDRLAAFRAANGGLLPEQTSLDKQLDFVVSELRGPESTALGRIMTAQGVADKAAQVSEAYLRPKDTVPEMQRRSATALRLARAWGGQGASGVTSTGVTPPSATASGFASLVPVPGAPTVRPYPPPPVQAGAAPVSPSPIVARTPGSVDVAGPAAAPPPAQTPGLVEPETGLPVADTLPPVAGAHPLYTPGAPGLQARATPLAPPPTAGQAPAPAVARPPVVPPPPAPSRTIPLEPVLPSGLTASQVQLAASMVKSGAPVAEVAAHVAQWRQLNTSNQQQAANNAAVTAQADFERQKYYVEQQQKAEQTQYERTRNAAADARAEAEAKRAGLPSGYRLGENGQAVRIDGLPTDPAVLEAQKNASQQVQQQFERENTLRDEFQKLTGDFRIVQTSYENIRNSAKIGDGASDMSLLYNYVRLLDPTSVVRESEFATAAASGSLGQRVQGAVERIMNGARLPDSLRESFVRESKNLYDNQLRSHNTIADQYEKLARANGLEPERVVTRFARPQEDAGPPAVKSAEDYNKLPSGAVYTDPDGHTRKKP